MKPISFHPRERIFTSDEPDIVPLPVLPISYSDGYNGLVSCWKPGLKDIIRILVGKPIYLILLSDFQPPCSLSTDRFEVTGREDEQEPGPEYGGDTELKPRQNEDL